MKTGCFITKKSIFFGLLDPNNVYNAQKVSGIVAEISNKLNREPVNSIFIFKEEVVKNLPRPKTE